MEAKLTLSGSLEELSEAIEAVLSAEIPVRFKTPQFQDIMDFAESLTDNEQRFVGPVCEASVDGRGISRQALLERFGDGGLLDGATGQTGKKWKSSTGTPSPFRATRGNYQLPVELAKDILKFL